LFKKANFLPYILIVFLNAITDLGHKIILQNTIFKSFEGGELMFLTAIVNALIILPFVFLFSASGFISDRFDKVQVIRYASFAAIVITGLITVAYYLGWFEVAFALTIMLAAQSAIYSPAKYGLIKELFGAENITRANAMVQAVTILSILLGAVIYSLFFESLLQEGSSDPREILQLIAPLGFVLIASSIVEFALALRLTSLHSGSSELTFEFGRYLSLEYFRKNTMLAKRQGVVWQSIIGLSIFWGVSQIVVASFGAYLKDEMGVVDTVTAQGMLSLGGLGIVVGSMISAKVSKNYIESGTVPIGAFGIALSLFCIPYMESLFAIALLFFAYGVFGGLFIVPLNALIQFNTPIFRIGKVLAANNFYQNSTMFVMLITVAYLSYTGLQSGDILLAVASIALIGAIYTVLTIPQTLVRYLVKSVVSIGLKVEVKGLEHIPTEGGVLLLGNHISYLDWAVLQISYPKQIRFVMERRIYSKWYFKFFLDFFNVIPVSKAGSKEALKEIGRALENGDTVALFPEGYLSRNAKINRFQRGFEIALKSVKQCKIVPFYIHGLWGSQFSHAPKKARSLRNSVVSITFGKAMEQGCLAHEVKREVDLLSIREWEHYITTLPTIPAMALERLKREKRFFAADSTGVKLDSSRYLTGALFLRDRIKKEVQHDENVGIILPSSVGGSLVNLALLMLGKCVVNLNFTTGEKPLKSALELADIQTVITSKKFIEKLRTKGFLLDNLMENRNVLYVEDIKKSAPKSKQILFFIVTRFMPVWLLKQLFIQESRNDQRAVILFSSGSEGVPKGIELSHKNIIGNIKQAVMMLHPEEDEVMAATLPIFHSFGLTICTFLPILESIPVVYHPDPTDGYAIGKIVKEYQATVLLGTATFLRLYTRNKKLKQEHFDSLRKVIVGAEKLPHDVREEFYKKFDLEIYEGYGATETSPAASSNIPDVHLEGLRHIQVGHKQGTIGMPLVGTIIMIVDPTTFEELDTGEEGMIIVGGVSVMKGYLKNEAKTSEVIKEKEGIRWYVTGDKGYIDEDGFVTIVDRYSRFAKIGGEMVSLGAVEEQVKKTLPKSIDIAATALPDSKKGERVVLLYKSDEAIDIKKRLIEANMNPLFIPSDYFQVEEIPILGTGKQDFKGIKSLAKEMSP
jgi:acyl-[acyl-carrier-protein]-phospholipid O-acyltransferase/long-chain-fatty-acid--[acyl-carrier-protein] ligase